MTEVVPSYLLKAARAEKHLLDLRAELARWADSRPYAVRTSREGKKQVHRLHFTSSPPVMASMIAADFVYNIRSGLNHLMAALVPAAERSGVYFPIYFEGVWEDTMERDDEERTKARGRWKSDPAKVRSEAVAILKALQPTPGVQRDEDGEIHSFQLINSISNMMKITAGE